MTRLVVLPLLLLAVLALDGCRFKPACDVEKGAASVLATAVAYAGDCTNVAALEKDFGALLQSKLHLCDDTQAKTGPISMMICPIVGAWAKSELQSLLSSGEAAQKYGCSGEKLATAGAALLTSGCEALPF